MAATDNNYIIDASVVLAWLLPDEIYQQSANNILELYKQKKIELTAPTLLPYEIVNGVKTSVLRKRIQENTSREIIRRYKALAIELIGPEEENILKVAIEEKISAYDGTYASLLATQNKSLITADKKLVSSLKKSFTEKVIWITDFKNKYN